MVLRSGIIIPFQFRDCKKLLMIGVPEENRDLSIWDLKNVVRAAFGIYNFEFRNKKIGFIIPDELLLHYLAQRHDLTNFVIEIGQAGESADIKEQQLSFEASCSSSQKLHVQLPQRSSESIASHEHAGNYTNTHNNHNHNATNTKSPSLTNHSSDHSSSQEPPHKMRIAQVYANQTPETMTQSIDPLDIIPKSEQDEIDMEAPSASDDKYKIEHQTLQQQQQQLLQQHQQAQSQAQFFGNYTHGTAAVTGAAGATQQSPQPQQPCTPPLMNRFRRRGERMSKDQKEVYVKYFEENPCMLTQRRNDIMLEPHWNKLSAMLNAVPQGAVKNVEEWKQTFDAWRYRVFMYTRYNSKLSGSAAQNPKNYKPLTPTDQRAYAMWTSHKSTMPQDYEKMDMFSQLEETQADYDY